MKTLYKTSYVHTYQNMYTETESCVRVMQKDTHTDEQHFYMVCIQIHIHTLKHTNYT